MAKEPKRYEDERGNYYWKMEEVAEVEVVEKKDMKASEKKEVEAAVADFEKKPSKSKKKK